MTAAVVSLSSWPATATSTSVSSVEIGGGAGWQSDMVASMNAQHIVSDSHGDVILIASPNNTNAHPDNRVWYEPGRLMSVGGRQFLPGGTIPAGPTSDGQLISYRFLKTGRYLVICMNRTHFLNDWMFGFVNVAGHDHDD